MTLTSTLLAPGRRYLQIRHPAGPIAGRITVMDTERDSGGGARLIYPSPSRPVASHPRPTPAD